MEGPVSQEGLAYLLDDDECLHSGSLGTGAMPTTRVGTRLDVDYFLLLPHALSVAKVAVALRKWHLRPMIPLHRSTARLEHRLQTKLDTLVHACNIQHAMHTPYARH